MISITLFLSDFSYMHKLKIRKKETIKDSAYSCVVKRVNKEYKSPFGFDKVRLKGAGFIEFYLLGLDGLLINRYFPNPFNHDLALSIDDRLKSNSLHL